MDRTVDDLRGLQQPVIKGLDEMSQQTLDALKIVHSFESKPARSERIREMMERKQPQMKYEVSKQPGIPETSLVGYQACAEPVQACEVYDANSNVNSIKIRSGPEENDIGKRSLEKHASTPSQRHSEVTLKDNVDGASKASLPKLPKPSVRKLEDAGITKLASLKAKRIHGSKIGETSMTMSAIPAVRTKGSSTTYSAISRLMQPTAASVAKANPKVLPKPFSKGLTNSSHTSSGQTSQALPSMLDQPSLGTPSIKPSSLTKNSKSANTNININGIGNLARTKVPSLKPLSTTVMPSQSVSSMSTPITKSYLKNPGIFKTKVDHEVMTVNPNMLSLDCEHNSPPKTSTPVRPLVAISEQEQSSMHSIDYSNFSNFSYVADWAQTPELAKKALEQRNVDTRRLFGSIPPVDIEAIFGSEIRKQQRQ